ncbi:alpha/beta hydrolase [Alteromonas sp. ASW11-36]|uniref:Alpha/beta hydrolase n=1 Tax=Alteromonas arenosi TaxID=3055817 RepID=A0ABT7SSZ6_9ALTE|nr:alpha/beta hydrolase [Alteromonas sp. ASW11-36]MDM7859114.1 alpha/beta hydrolase [Alteromonas sp. ASW11-36]
MWQIEQPTIFLPGTLCDERVWLPLWQNCNFAAGCRQYAPLQWANDLEQMLSLTFDRLNSAPEPVHLVGFSMGGYVAALAALQHRNIAKLTLVGYNPRGLDATEEKQRLAIIKSINSGGFKNFSDERLLQFITPQELEDTSAGDTIREMAADLGGATLKAHFTATTPRQDLTQKLAKAHFPIHFIAAEHDKVAPLLAIKECAKHISNAKVTAIHNTAHMMLLTTPNDCGNAIFS